MRTDCTEKPFREPFLCNYEWQLWVNEEKKWKKDPEIILQCLDKGATYLILMLRCYGIHDR